MSAPVTCIRRAAWVVAWDAARGSHVYLRDADIAFAGGAIIHVGGHWDGVAARDIDGAALFVIPGLINIHCHPAQSPIFRGFVEEFGNPRLFYSSRHRFRQAFIPDTEAQLASARFGLAELLAGGVTTAVDLSHAYPGWIELLAESGIRAVAAPMFRSAAWFTETGQETQYEWAPDLGEAAFAEAAAVMEAAERHPSGRLSAMVSPAQVDTCTPELLQRSAALARDTGRPLHTHAAQSYAEFAGMTRRHDMTPIAWLHRLGFLGPRTILGHAVFTDEHPWLVWPRRDDLRLLAESGTAVAHCPTVFLRDGTLLHDLGTYLEAGIRIAIGTDTHPQSLLEEMRTAELLARAAAGTRHRCDTARVFHAATIAAAEVLGRADLGRLAVGARADIVCCTLDHPAMQPLRDPLRNLIHVAAERVVRDVWVDGRQVVADGRVLTIDQAAAARALQGEQDRLAAAVAQRDPERASIEDLMPLALALGA
ncbi:N-ethylammeline chlorohydrolase [Falsiroseomonas bella]|uniref:N-ethylammeline chlorohydrolase n=1 Tax=Falsiroseomonas bella TaxID=2184016 RepID=A0A317FJ36_9PROT|nr:amidohydrolase family protein [Falsiroseomonas bella]PWS37969.1 N-ethylammeline chlorohydrolase [Falsiroseomonas bella]